MDTPPSNRRLLTLEEVQQQYGEKVAPLDLLYHLIHKGKLPASRPGRHYVVAADDVEKIFAPTVRAVLAKKKEKVSPKARESKQLSKAGIRT